MNILYIILTEKENVNQDTLDSIKQNLQTKDKIEVVNFEDNEINQPYYKSLEFINKKDTIDCDYVCIVPNNSTLTENFRVILNEYEDKSTNNIYLPLGLLISKKSKRGLFNTCVWSPQAANPGKLDHQLALAQTDTVLFGALIPKEIFFDESYYSKTIKFYQHYYLLNNWSKLENINICGIPKILVNLDFDLNFSEFSKEEKMKNYKLANEEFLTQNA